MRVKILIGVGFFVSGVAIACKTLPFPVPPVPVKISWSNVASAKAAGYSNPLHAAAMSKLDSLASTAIGAGTWTTNNFQGYFTYSGPLGGASTIFIDKPCGKKAVDSSAASAASTGGGGGGSGGGGGGSGGTLIGSGCYGNCGKVDVGELENA